MIFKKGHRMLIGLIPVFLFGIIQWLVLRSVPLVLGATVLLAILGFVYLDTLQERAGVLFRRRPATHTILDLLL